LTTEQSVAAQTEGLTIPKLLHRNAREYGDLPAITSLDAEGRPTLTWSQFRDEIAAVARGLADLGLERGQRMLIMATSRPEHIVSDLAAAHLGVISCTAYSTLSPEQIRFVARHSAAPVVVLEGKNELERWLPVLDDLPALRKVVMMEPEAIPEGDDRFVGYAELKARGAELHTADPGIFERTWAAIRPDDPLSMIYTSGTTGDPKGVVLSHRNVIHEGRAVHRLHGTPMHTTNVAYLPLAHIAERELSVYLPIVWAGHVHTLADTSGIIGALGQVRPQGFFGVPRVWEKMVAGLKNMLANAPEDRQKVLTEANELLQEGYKLRSDGKEVPAGLAERIAETDRTVLAPVRQLLGLDQLILASSGAAALPVEILYFIAGLGVEIQEVWGLSETTGAVTSNTPSAYRAGTVGRPLADVEVRTGEDGELLVRGPIVFLGYLQEDGSIAKATDDDGWLPTGDIGTVDEDGYVRITDRKKELIITSSGKNIPPTRIEGLLKEHPLIGQAAAIGDRRPYVTALIVLDDEIAPAWASARGIEVADVGELAGHPLVRAEIDRAVQSANDRLARIEQIKRYHLVPKAWTPETGELTPTLKLKRRVIDERYQPKIEELYQGTRSEAPA
jgi:long-chain acyl-CoA synthetase